MGKPWRSYNRGLEYEQMCFFNTIMYRKDGRSVIWVKCISSLDGVVLEEMETCRYFMGEG